MFYRKDIRPNILVSSTWKPVFLVFFLGSFFSKLFFATELLPAVKNYIYKVNQAKEGPTGWQAVANTSLRWFWPGSATTASVFGHDLGSSLGQSLLVIDNLDVILFVWKEAVGKFSCIVITAERRLNCEEPVGIRSWEQSLIISFTSVKTRQRFSDLVWSQMRWQTRCRTASPICCCHVISYCWELLGKGQSAGMPSCPWR